MLNKFLILIVLAIADASISVERFIEQPLDHFDVENNETWTMVRSSLFGANFLAFKSPLIFSEILR